MNTPDPSQKPAARRFTFNVFEKNLETGQHVRVNTPADQAYGPEERSESDQSSFRYKD